MASHCIDTNLILPIARQILEFLESTEASARSEIARASTPRYGAVLDVNVANRQMVAEELTRISVETKRELMRIIDEPAIARVVTVDEHNQSQILFICRATPPSVNIPGVSAVSYRAPMGRLGSFNVGDGGGEISLPRGNVYLELAEKATFEPVKKTGEGWDSRRTVFQFEGVAPSTATSLIALLPSDPALAGVDDILDRILQAERREKEITAGITRTIIDRMGLRDQPLLDKFQDEIFRLPISKQLVLLGPAGTGKTTTLIRRLGLKLDWEHLGEGERRAVESSAAARERHQSSWLMFTPTELLKAYLKEAFSIEGIPASDERITTWSDYRTALARNHLRILKTPHAGGRFILRESQGYVANDTLMKLPEWFDDFQSWQDERYWLGIEQSITALNRSSNRVFADAGALAQRLLNGWKDRRNFEALLRLASIATGAQKELENVRDRIELDVRTGFSNFLNADKNLLDELAKMLTKLDDGTDDADEIEEEVDNLPRQKGSRELAFDAFQQTMFTLARAKYLKRNVGASTRAGRISAWLKDRQLSTDQLLAIGQAHDDISNLRILMSPLSRYLNGLSARYQMFRTQRSEGNKWYTAVLNSARDISGPELDLVVLAYLKTARQVLSVPQISAMPDEQLPAVLRSIKREYRSQILVDEVADFSCVQIAGMRSLCDPSLDSFMACGDFNQRLTMEGVRSDSDLAWSIGMYEGFRIDIVYRQTRQLAELAQQLSIDTGVAPKALSLPRHTNMEGVDPVFGPNLNSVSLQAAWLRDRITEVQHLTRTLPSIAVLVNEEPLVKPIADKLHELLVEQNIQVEACIGGKFVGSEGRVRVFDVKHIKGLEFEAVFFLSIDELADKLPKLFDRYLYVGATRAATYLGITTTKAKLPRPISQLEGKFKLSWP